MVGPPGASSVRLPLPPLPPEAGLGLAPRPARYVRNLVCRGSACPAEQPLVRSSQLTCLRFSSIGGQTATERLWMSVQRAAAKRPSAKGATGTDSSRCKRKWQEGKRAGRHSRSQSKAPSCGLARLPITSGVCCADHAAPATCRTNVALSCRDVHCSLVQTTIGVV